MKQRQIISVNIKQILKPQGGYVYEIADAFTGAKICEQETLSDAVDFCDDNGHFIKSLINNGGGIVNE